MLSYLHTYARVTDPLWDSALTPREAIETALRHSAKMQCERGHPKGCMVALGILSAPSEVNKSVTEPLTRSRERTRAGIKACVQRGAVSGELRAGVDVRALTTVFDSFLLGLSTLARDGVPLAAMNAGIAQIMTVWDASCQHV